MTCNLKRSLLLISIFLVIISTSQQFSFRKLDNSENEISELVENKENIQLDDKTLSNETDESSISESENEPIADETMVSSEPDELNNQSQNSTDEILTDEEQHTSNEENINNDQEITTEESSTEEQQETTSEEKSEQSTTMEEKETSTEENKTEDTITELQETTSEEKDDFDKNEEKSSTLDQENETETVTEEENINENDASESNNIADDYESEAQTTEEETTTTTTTRKSTEKQTIWFKPTKPYIIINDSYNDESHITANCPSLNCEFGYKTDLYGKPICSCFNPCYEKKCGSNICKIEKLTEDKFIGACYDPTKIERPLHCHLPLATGSCKNYTSKFYFNSFLGRCTHFIYTGCNGNANNFEKWEKCEMECNTCSLPAARGPCHGNIIRYYFDSARRECVAFNWGGCKGNDNNFSSRKHCEDSCLFRKEGALFLHGMPVRTIRKYNEGSKTNQDSRA